MKILEPLSAVQEATPEGVVAWDKGFPKSARLLDKADFRLVTSTGRRRGGRFFLLFSLNTGCGNSRLGMTVSRKVGKAVLRNRIKRQMREFFRIGRGALDHGRSTALDIVLIARPHAGSASPAALGQDLQKLFSSLNKPP